MIHDFLSLVFAFSTLSVAEVGFSESRQTLCDWCLVRWCLPGVVGCSLYQEHNESTHH